MLVLIDRTILVTLPLLFSLPNFSATRTGSDTVFLVHTVATDTIRPCRTEIDFFIPCGAYIGPAV